MKILFSQQIFCLLDGFTNRYSGPDSVIKALLTWPVSDPLCSAPGTLFDELTYSNELGLWFIEQDSMHSMEEDGRIWKKTTNHYKQCKLF